MVEHTLNFDEQSPEQKQEIENAISGGDAIAAPQIKSDADDSLPFTQTEEIHYEGPDIEPEPYETEQTSTALTVKQRIERLPEQFDTNKQKIADWKTEYENFTVFNEAGEVDKEKLKKAEKAKSLMVKARTGSKGVADKLKSEAKEYIDGVNTYLKELHAGIAEIEDPLAEEIKKAKDDAERKKREKEEEEARRFSERVTDVMGHGMAYVGNAYQIGTVTVEPATLKSMDDAFYQQFLQQVKTLNEQEVLRKQQEEQAAEQKRKEQEEQQAELKRQQDKLKEQQDEQAKKQKEFDNQQAAFKKQQDDFAETQRLETERKANEEKAAKKLQNDNRAAELMGMGLSFSDANVYSFSDISVSRETMEKLNAVEWVGLMGQITPLLNTKKQEAEAEKQRQAAEQKKKDDEAAAQREKDEAARLEALKPDKEKLMNFALLLEALEIPEITDPEAFKVISGATELLAKTSAYIKQQIENLK